MSEDQTMSADTRVVADRYRFGRVDVRHLQHDRTAAEREARLRQLRPSYIHLLANAGVLTDGDPFARDIAHRAHAGVSSNLDRAAHDDRKQTDLHVVAETHVLSDDDASKREPDAPTDLVTEHAPIRPHFEGARHPSEKDEVF